MKKSSKSPPISFSSLPYEMVVNCLARISRFHRPTLALVSKSFRSLMASPELDATRARMRVTEDCLYVCLDMGNKNNHDPRWFRLAPIPKRPKLLPVLDLFPCQHPKSSTVVSMGSEMYLIGGIVNKTRSRTMLALDCRSHQWRSLPEMIVPRDRPAAEVIHDKIYVIGGCSEHEHWGEVYDPKTLTWEPLSPTTSLELTTQKSVVPGRLVMGGKVYQMNGLKLSLKTCICLAEIETNVWCELGIFKGKLHWRDANADSMWRSVKGLRKIYPYQYFNSVANSGGRRVTVWCKSRVEHLRQGLRDLEKCKTYIWCAEITLQRHGVSKLRGCVEWFKSVYTLGGLDCSSKFLLHSALVTH
ncbi:unnamed protein product [Microthlaspi erraticum]|uniref:F-box domain-containing protein n=1 Tax=Microthlaspi erraticum TaxID=1685480 RepID=A0A6D2JN89_9BRAS|nr:unnamed protein product [Microthlaspi erraticum]